MRNGNRVAKAISWEHLSLDFAPFLRRPLVGVSWSEVSGEHSNPDHKQTTTRSNSDNLEDVLLYVLCISSEKPQTKKTDLHLPGFRPVLLHFLPPARASCCSSRSCQICFQGQLQKSLLLSVDHSSTYNAIKARNVAFVSTRTKESALTYIFPVPSSINISLNKQRAKEAMED